MPRRLVLPSLVLFAVFLAGAQLAETQPRFRAWLADAFAGATGVPHRPEAGATASASPAARAELPPPPAADGRPGSEQPPRDAESSPRAALPGATDAAQAGAGPGAAVPPSDAAAPAATSAVEPAPPGTASPPEEPALPPDVAPPGAPAGVTAVATTGHQIALRWRPATDDRGVVAYEVHRGGALVARTAETGTVEGGLASAREHCYVVRAVDAAGNASEASQAACATTPDTTPPVAPATVDVEPTGERSVRLSWSPAQDDVAVAGYEVARGGQVVASGPDAAAIEDGLTPLSEVCYEVIALDAAGNRSKPSPAACARLPDLTPPTPPTAVAVHAVSETTAALTWSGAADASGVASYDLVRAGATVATSDAERADDHGLAAGRTFCWTVRARDPAGNVSKDSAQACATTPDLTPPGAPPGFSAAPSAASRVAFAWEPAEDNVGVERYEVSRDGRLVARTAAAKLGGVEGGLAPSTEYCFTLVAIDAAGNRSPAAGPACARTTEPGVPAGPTALHASPRSANVVVLRWDSSPDPGMVYTVYWGGDKRIGATPRTEYTVAGLRPGEKRCYRVAAVDGAGKESPSTIERCAAPALRSPSP